MYPVMLDLSVVKVMLVGNGPITVRRLAQLDEDNAQHITVYADAPCPELIEAAGRRLVRHHPLPQEFAGVQVAMVVDIEETKAAAIARLARAYNVIVNVEDRKEYCDFYFPSFLRRGALLLAISTSGASPILAKYIRGYLSEIFGPEWEAITDEIAQARLQWKAQGLTNQQVIEESMRFIMERKLLGTDRVKEVA